MLVALLANKKLLLIAIDLSVGYHFDLVFSSLIFVGDLVEPLFADRARVGLIGGPLLDAREAEPMLTALDPSSCLVHLFEADGAHHVLLWVLAFRE